MAKKSPTGQSVQWENTLPSTYETITDGFHAEMSVQELANFIDADIAVPANIKNIKIGSFTPNMFAEPEWAEFWSRPVLVNQKSVVNAANDPDIVEVLAKTGYHFDPQKLNLESLARLAQVQYLGSKLRVAGLVNDTFFARLNKLKDPEFYKKLLESDVNKQLGYPLPKEMPHFEIKGEKFSIKTVESAMDKAGTRTGKPDDKAAFLKAPGNYGVFAVSDVMRTKLTVSKGKSTDKDLKKKYRAVRDVLAIAGKTGDLGIVFNECTDQISYPPTDRATDNVPVVKANGRLYHAGPCGTVLETPIELQLPGMPAHADEFTHIIYNDARELKKQIEQLKRQPMENAAKIEQLAGTIKLLDKQRFDTFNLYLPFDLQETRARFTSSRMAQGRDSERDLVFDRGDVVGKALHEQSALLAPDSRTHRRALQVANHEFLEDYQKSNTISIVVPLEPGNQHPICKRAWKMMIQNGKDVTSVPPVAVPAALGKPVFSN